MENSSKDLVGVITIKTIDQTGDAYIDSCFRFDFQQYKEDRDWSQIPEAIAIARAGNAGETEEGIRLAKELRNKYLDFDFCYSWLGNLYLRLNSYGEAYNAVSEGLRLARSKYSLCRTMGMIHLKVGELPEAVKWWIRSLVIRICAHKLNDVEILIYLSYVAEALGLDTECSILRRRADDINSGGIRLSSQKANELYAWTRQWSSSSMKQAITLLVHEYITPEVDRKLKELRKIAPNGVFCQDCKQRYKIEECKSPDIDGEMIIFGCPKCRINIMYNPKEDVGL